MSAPEVDYLAELIIKKNPLHGTFIRNSLSKMSNATLGRFKLYLNYCKSRGVLLEVLANSYHAVIRDMQVEQVYFRRHKRYRCRSFHDANGRIYTNREYMRSYMYGLAITSFFWPSHATINDFFLRILPPGLKGNYLEIGPGHGYYFIEAYRNGNFDKMTGIDVSMTSVDMTRDIIDYFVGSAEGKIDILHEDFMSLRPRDQKYSMIVASEVIEHLDSPLDFVRKIAQICTTETIVYITTCINAPAVDHIFLFEGPDQVEAVFGRCGFEVIDKIYVGYPGMCYEQSMKDRLPVNVAYRLRRRA